MKLASSDSRVRVTLPPGTDRSFLPVGRSSVPGPAPDHRAGVPLQRRHGLAHWLQQWLLRNRRFHDLEVVHDAPPSRLRHRDLLDPAQLLLDHPSMGTNRG